MNTIFKIATLAAVLTLVACGPEQEVVETEDAATEATEATEVEAEVAETTTETEV